MFLDSKGIHSYALTVALTVSAFCRLRSCCPTLISALLSIGFTLTTLALVGITPYFFNLYIYLLRTKKRTNSRMFATTAHRKH